MRLVHAGASILSNGKTSNIKPNGNGLYLNGSKSEKPAIGCGPKAVAGFGQALKESTGGRGGVTVLTSPASGSLCLTPPQVEAEIAMKEDISPSPSFSGWQEFWDEEVGASYYYNCVTGEALWVRPDGF